MESQDILIGLCAYALLMTVGLSSLYVTRTHRDTLPFQQKLFVVSMTVRSVAAAALHEPSVYAIVVGDADASGWELGRVFRETVDRSVLGPLVIPDLIASGYHGVNQGYGTMVGLYFYVTRLDSQLAAAVLSCFAGALTTVMTYRLARLVLSEWVAVRTGWLVCFLPSMIIWSIQTIKEPIVILCELGAIYACTALRTRHFAWNHILLWLISILLLLPLRFYAAYMLTAVIFVSLLAPRLGRGSIPFGSAVTGGAILFSIMSMASDTVRLHQDVFDTYDVDKVESFRNAVASGHGSGSGVQSTIGLDSGTGLILATLIGGTHLLLAPFPWQFAGSSTRLLLTAPEMVIWWILVIRGLGKGLTRCVRRQPGDVLPMLLFMIVLGSVYSVMFGNIGIIYRQRAQLTPYLVMLIMVGFEASRAKRIRLSAAEQEFDLIAPLARAASALETV